MRYGWWLLMGIFLISGCENLSLSKKPKKEEIKPQRPVLARVNDWYITPADFDTMIRNINAVSNITGVRIESYEERKDFLQRLVRQEILAQYAKKEGLDKQRDIALSIKNAIRGILVDAIQRRIDEEIEVSFKEIEDFYNKYKESLKEPEQRKVREIVVDSENLARQILARIYQGENFAQLAQQFSLSDSKTKGGDLGYISYDPKKKFPLFWTNVLTLEKDQVSSYFKSTEEGKLKGKYYIVKVEDIKSGRQRTIGELQDNIKEAIKLDKRQKRIDSIINKMKEESTVEINESYLGG